MLSNNFANPGEPYRFPVFWTIIFPKKNPDIKKGFKNPAILDILLKSPGQFC